MKFLLIIIMFLSASCQSLSTRPASCFDNPSWLTLDDSLLWLSSRLNHELPRLHHAALVVNQGQKNMLEASLSGFSFNEEKKLLSSRLSPSLRGMFKKTGEDVLFFSRPISREKNNSTELHLFVVARYISFEEEEELLRTLEIYENRIMKLKSKEIYLSSPWDMLKDDKKLGRKNHNLRVKYHESSTCPPSF